MSEDSGSVGRALASGYMPNRVNGAVHQDESIIDDLPSRDGMRSTMYIRPALQTGQSGSLPSPEVVAALLTVAAVG